MVGFWRSLFAHFIKNLLSHKTSNMYERDRIRIASSELSELLFGNTSKYRLLLGSEKERLMGLYPDAMILDSMFEALDSRIINICPMVLCDAMLKDVSVDSPDELLAALGLTMFSISTHDDLVDELPQDRVVIAGLTYSGNIATLEGLKLLIENGYGNVVLAVLDCVNKNHYYQTKIAGTLWKAPTDEEGYLEAISHTKYWVASGLKAAIVFARREDLHPFVDEFSECYGTTCQLFDDIREIKDDLKNGYWSLPISLAIEHGWDLGNPKHLNMAIQRSHELAALFIRRAKTLCGSSFPNLYSLVENIERVGGSIHY